LYCEQGVLSFPRNLSNEKSALLEARAFDALRSPGADGSVSAALGKRQS